MDLSDSFEHCFVPNSYGCWFEPWCHSQNVPSSCPILRNYEQGKACTLAYQRRPLHKVARPATVICQASSSSSRKASKEENDDGNSNFASPASKERISLSSIRKSVNKKVVSRTKSKKQAKEGGSQTETEDAGNSEPDEVNKNDIQETKQVVLSHRAVEEIQNSEEEENQSLAMDRFETVASPTTRANAASSKVSPLRTSSTKLQYSFDPENGESAKPDLLDETISASLKPAPSLDDQKLYLEQRLQDLRTSQSRVRDAETNQPAPSKQSSSRSSMESLNDMFSQLGQDPRSRAEAFLNFLQTSTSETLGDSGTKQRTRRTNEEESDVLDQDAEFAEIDSMSAGEESGSEVTEGQEISSISSSSTATSPTSWSTQFPNEVERQSALLSAPGFQGESGFLNLDPVFRSQLFELAEELSATKDSNATPAEYMIEKAKSNYTSRLDQRRRDARYGTCPSCGAPTLQAELEANDGMFCNVCKHEARFQNMAAPTEAQRRGRNVLDDARSQSSGADPKLGSENTWVLGKRLRSWDRLRINLLRNPNTRVSKLCDYDDLDLSGDPEYVASISAIQEYRQGLFDASIADLRSAFFSQAVDVSKKSSESHESRLQRLIADDYGVESWKVFITNGEQAALQMILAALKSSASMAPKFLQGAYNAVDLRGPVPSSVVAFSNIIIPDPSSDGLHTAIRLAGLDPREYRFRCDMGFAPEVQDIRDKVDTRTRAILVSSPDVGTVGSMVDTSVLESIACIADDYKLPIIINESGAGFVMPKRRGMSQSKGQQPPVISVVNIDRCCDIVSGIQADIGLDVPLLIYSSADLHLGLAGMHLGWIVVRDNSKQSLQKCGVLDCLHTAHELGSFAVNPVMLPAFTRAYAEMKGYTILHPLVQTNYELVSQAFGKHPLFELGRPMHPAGVSVLFSVKDVPKSVRPIDLCRLLYQHEAILVLPADYLYFSDSQSDPSRNSKPAFFMSLIAETKVFQDACERISRFADAVLKGRIELNQPKQQDVMHRPDVSDRT